MLLLVAAEGRELAGVRRHCERMERLRWPVEWAWRGELNGQAVVLAADGSGGVRVVGAVRTACEREKVAAVVSTGWCGAVAPGLAPGEILVASRVEAEGGGEDYACARPRTEGPFRTGRLVTVNRVAGMAAEKARLGAGGASAVDLEAVHVAAEAARRRLRFYCVRVVLDSAEESLGLDFEAAREDNGRLGRRQIVRAALERPWRGVPELARWARRSRAAARALGKFLAECSFDT